MKPVEFKQQSHVLDPSGKAYSENVSGVVPLPVWSDGEQCVSCWEMGWRERLSALVFGRVWLAILSGPTQPPVCVKAEREYFA